MLQACRLAGSNKNAASGHDKLELCLVGASLRVGMIVTQLKCILALAHKHSYLAALSLELVEYLV